jgi:ribokinase
MTRVAVVGHVEWVDFVPVKRFPVPGEIQHSQGAFTRAGGGGAVVSVVLAELGAEVDFFCALGDDRLGHDADERLRRQGVRTHVAWRDQPTRRAVTLLDGAGERTIITIGERLAPLGSDELDWERLRDADGVYVTAGDAGAVNHARRARIVVASPRARGALEETEGTFDALVYSSRDEGESEWARRVERRMRLLFATEGAFGGRWWGQAEGRWEPAAPPGEPRDAYGCGDSFAAGLAFGLAEGASIKAAAALGAQCGARCLTQAGAGAPS